MGADEGSSPLGKASRAYRPLASDRAAHSAAHTKKGGQHTDTERRAHTRGLKPKHASGLADKARAAQNAVACDTRAS